MPAGAFAQHRQSRACRQEPVQAVEGCRQGACTGSEGHAGREQEHRQSSICRVACAASSARSNKPAPSKRLTRAWHHLGACLNFAQKPSVPQKWTLFLLSAGCLAADLPALPCRSSRAPRPTLAQKQDCCASPPGRNPAHRSTAPLFRSSSPLPVHSSTPALRGQAAAQQALQPAGLSAAAATANACATDCCECCPRQGGCLLSQHPLGQPTQCIEAKLAPMHSQSTKCSLDAALADTAKGQLSSVS